MLEATPGFGRDICRPPFFRSQIRCKVRASRAEESNTMSHAGSRRENFLGREIAGAISMFWAGGSGPTGSSLSSAFALAGYEDTGGTKQWRVLAAVGDTDDETAKRVVEELLELLRASGVFLDDPPSENVVRLRRAFERRGILLTEQGYVDWTGASRTPSPATRAATPSVEVPKVVDETRKESIPTIELLIDSLRRLPYGLRALAMRRRDRPGLVITDEYDLQDVVEALLRTFYPDVRTEERTPSYAGSSSVMDFHLKAETAVVEVKVTREGRGEAEIKRELLVDIYDFREHPSVNRLIAVAYDLGSTFDNPTGFERDFSRMHGKLKVDVLVVGWPVPSPIPPRRSPG